ncbi:MAG: hypothetical protein ABW352_20660 [Polyangiales bacterium]
MREDSAFKSDCGLPIVLEVMAPFFRPASLSRFCLTVGLVLSGCSPVADPQAGDASVIYIDRTRDDAGNFSNALVHVAGLHGSGLALSIAGSQELDVPGDGVWHVPLLAPMQNIDITVATQPDSPAQECDVQKLDDAVFSILCHDEDWTVGGVINGLEGKGLRIALMDEGDNDDAAEGGAHSVFVAAQAGKFEFARPLVDGVAYHIEIVQQPTEPRQDCAVVTGEGVAEADVEDVRIDCVTRTYPFHINTVGLKGRGLVMNTEAGEFPIDPGFMAGFEGFPDGYRYWTEISHQPTNPSQVCFVQGGDGVIDGAAVNITIICDAQGQVRIAEVGACPFSSSACWFEIINTGAAPENLGFYKVRTSALSPTAFTPSRLFALPQVSIPQFGHAIIQGKVAGGMPDGANVFHIVEGDSVPWWGSDGFVELLNPAGATASFLRWGSNTMEPTTGGTYGGGSAPALPRGEAAYGYSLQHPNRPGKIPPAGDEFALLSVPTYGGPNDVYSSDDADQDGIPDVAEIPGGTFGGLSMYAMGARTNQKDLFIEIDHMAGADPATLPRKDALDKVAAAFLRKNIVLHFDVGPLFSPSFDPANYNLGGGNVVPFATAVGLAPKDAAIKSLYEIKAEHMAANRRMVFYYQLFAWSQQVDGSGGSSGVGELPGNDSIITLGGFGLTANTAAQRTLISSYQAASIMHELGHNFSLRHGGADSLNRKPNYVSVMNYLYSPLGLPTIGNAEGDRYDFSKRCTLTSVSQLTNSPSADLTKFMIDYSTGGSGTMDESAVREDMGLGRTGSSAVDFNCNGKPDGMAYSRDLNGDGALDILADNDDWSALDFMFRRYASGTDNGPSLRPSLERFDVLTAETSHHVDEPCPAPMVPSMAELQ